MSDPISLSDQAAAVERAAKGVRNADIRAQTRALVAAAATLRDLVIVRQSASEALDRMKAEDEAVARSRASGQAHVDDSRVSAALERSRRP